MEKTKKSSPGRPRRTARNIREISDALDSMGKVGRAKVYDPLPDDTVVRVRSVTEGALIYVPRQGGTAYVWDDMGAVCEIKFSGLREMYSRSPDFLTRPLVVLLDDGAAAYFGLGSLYAELSVLGRLPQILGGGEKEAERALDDAGAARIREPLIARLRQMYNNGELNDIGTARMLERKLMFEF